LSCVFVLEANIYKEQWPAAAAGSMEDQWWPEVAVHSSNAPGMDWGAHNMAVLLLASAPADQLAFSC